jgi:hypothetical protein
MLFYGFVIVLSTASTCKSDERINLYIVCYRYFVIPLVLMMEQHLEIKYLLEQNILLTYHKYVI